MIGVLMLAPETVVVVVEYIKIQDMSCYYRHDFLWEEDSVGK
jgi:hypothetical protein